jgi:Asp-tRNA(Asn)/Glu-tRNA(Gln) amidotransferase C subunit
LSSFFSLFISVASLFFFKKREKSDSFRTFFFVFFFFCVKVEVLYMMTEKEILHLSTLARIDIPKEQREVYAKEMDSILLYVKEIETMGNKEGGEEEEGLKNIFREDCVTHSPSEYTESITSLFPKKEGTALRVQKIL